MVHDCVVISALSCFPFLFPLPWNNHNLFSLGFKDNSVFSVTILPECYINFIILSIIQSAWTLISMLFYGTIWFWYLIRGCWCGSVNRVETISRNIYRYLSVVEREWNPTKWKGLLYPGTFPQSPAVHLSFFPSKADNR